jgi:uncharacterized protein YndB with AHSA1/START domain
MGQQRGRGDFRYVPEGVAVRFDRRVDATPAEVWAALTDPAVLGRWLGEVTVADRDVTVRLGHGAPAVPGRITYCDPRQMLEVDLQPPGEPPARLVGEVAGLGENRTVVVLEYRGLQEDVAADRAAEWHRRMDALAATVGGGADGDGGDDPGLSGMYAGVLAELRAGH